MATKAMSVSSEVAALIDAIEGGRILARGVHTRTIDNDRDLMRAPMAIDALLRLVVSRMTALFGVLQGEQDPACLIDYENQTDAEPIDERDLDTRLYACTDGVAPSALSGRRQQRHAGRSGVKSSKRKARQP